MEGKVQAKITTGGGRDNETGAPVPVSHTWGEEVECFYCANTLSNNGRYTDGAFKQASYTITVDEMEFDTTVVRLIDSSGNTVCEKPVLSLEKLESVQKVKIVL